MSKRIFTDAFFATFGVMMGWFVWGPLKECRWYASLELLALTYALALASIAGGLFLAGKLTGRSAE